ncbi:MAG: MoxR family ATPase [Actinobacteria bacterium]|nr:MoxR family ATPase [Actinomycetota bacterium]
MFDRPLFAPVASESTADSSGENVTAYEFDDHIVGAVNVAMAARRPLLVTGPPGAGKSSLAFAVARQLRWNYVQHVLTSRTELSDLTSGFDAVQRLADAQLQRLRPDWTYLRPGVLWWAFAPESAATLGHVDEKPPPVRDPRVKGSLPDTVVLLDEIDKAEPDVPNDLLEPLDLRGLQVREVGEVRAEHEVFVVITSNGERRLPPAFLRRCVHLHLSPTDSEFFVTVARAHFGARDDMLYSDVAVDFERYREAARNRSRREPSTAEYLDTVRACLRLDVRPGSAGWNAIVEAALWKDPELPEEVDHELVR